MILQQTYIQWDNIFKSGRRNLFETVVNIENSNSDLTIKADEDNLDGMNFVAGKSLDFVNKKAMEGTIKAHVNRKCS